MLIPPVNDKFKDFSRSLSVFQVLIYQGKLNFQVLFKPVPTLHCIIEKDITWKPCLTGQDVHIGWDVLENGRDINMKAQVDSWKWEGDSAKF